MDQKKNRFYRKPKEIETKKETKLFLFMSSKFKDKHSFFVWGEMGSQGLSIGHLAGSDKICCLRH